MRHIVGLHEGISGLFVEARDRGGVLGSEPAKRHGQGSAAVRRGRILQEFPVHMEGISPCIIMVFVPLYPPVQGGGGDLPLVAELADGACAVEIRFEDFHDERQGIRREGDHPADLDAVVIVAVLVAAGTQALATSPAEVRRDLYFAFPRLSAIRPDEPARIDGGLPPAPVVLVATGAWMREGVIGGKAVQNVLREAETGRKVKWGQKFEISLQWSFLSLHAKREGQGASLVWQWRFDIYVLGGSGDKLWSVDPRLLNG